ncbi:hypothetical protein TNCT_632051 [Trichonephila clavata]|uniref:Uncharacterized protein n=1 Tax=Trichonephila clavata TaxID=2740835 RepID=A0A8X6J2U4_TRICU|nr:hypothetical protein TNCT_632051 [Trichonephila clavata]
MFFKCSISTLDSVKVIPVVDLVLQLWLLQNYLLKQIRLLVVDTDPGFRIRNIHCKFYFLIKEGSERIPFRIRCLIHLSPPAPVKLLVIAGTIETWDFTFRYIKWLRFTTLNGPDCSLEAESFNDSTCCGYGSWISRLRKLHHKVHSYNQERSESIPLQSRCPILLPPPGTVPPQALANF